MSFSGFITVAVGLLAVLGVGGVFIGMLSPAPDVRSWSLKMGAFAFVAAGLIMTLEGLLGLVGQDEIVGGFMLIVFGTGLSWPAGKVGDRERSGQTLP